MELRTICSLVLLVAATLMLLVSTEAFLHSSGLHVCLDRESNQLQQQPKLTIETYCQPTFKHYFARCAAPNGGYRLCSRYTTVYHTAYRRRYVAPAPPVDRYTCCPGWSQTHRYSKSCTEAVCTQECQNGGKCLRPNNCACPSGWTGQYCEIDINECGTTTHGCQQQCVNTNGSYTCQCQSGYTLAEDGRSCSICVSCTPEYQFLVARVNLLERDVSHLKQNQTRLSAVVHNPPPPPAPEPELVQQKPPQAISALPPLNDQYIAQIQRIGSLSEQIAMLEERLADCSCRRRHSNKGKR